MPRGAPAPATIEPQCIDFADVPALDAARTSLAVRSADVAGWFFWTYAGAGLILRCEESPVDRGPWAETIGLRPHPSLARRRMSRLQGVVHHIEMPGVADYVTVGDYIPPSNGVAGLEAELGQWNDGIKTEVRAQSPRERAKA